MRKTEGKGMGSAFGPCPDCDGTGWVDGPDGDAGARFTPR